MQAGKRTVWIIQPGVAPYRIPLFKRISEAPGLDLTVMLLCKQVPFQTWNIDHQTLPFRTELVEGINREVSDERVVHDRQIQFSFPLAWKLLVQRPDVVFCSGFMFSTLLVYLVTRITRKPYFIWNEGTIYTDSDLGRVKLLLRKLMARSAAGFITAGTLASEYIEKELGQPTEGRSYLSYNCVENARFGARKVNDVPESLRQRFPARNLLFVGRFIETKGISEMMGAYRSLVQDRGMNDLGLILLGEGRLEGYIKDYAREHELENVFIEGFVSQEDIQDYYALADIFVLLSLSDPNPLVVFEALASGIPIVLSYRAGNARDFLRDGENGYVVDPYDHEGTVEKLARCLEEVDRDTASEVSQRLVDRANYDSSAQAFIGAVNDTVSRNG